MSQNDLPISIIDYERRLTEILERLAGDYDQDLSLDAISDAVREARSDVAVLQLPLTQATLSTIELLARQTLDATASALDLRPRNPR